MNRDIALRADELTFGYGAAATEEAIERVQDSVEVRSRREAESWVSTAFELVRRGKALRRFMPDRSAGGS